MGKNKKETEDINASVVLPIAKKVMATIHRLNMESITLRRNKVIAEVKAINRDRKIKSFLEDKPFEEMKIEEHPKWIIDNLFL